VTKRERDHAAKLERIMRSHEGWEKRTLADLRVAGYKFTSIDQANRYLKAQRTMAGMSSQQIVAARAGTPEQETEQAA